MALTMAALFLVSLLGLFPPSAAAVDSSKIPQLSAFVTQAERTLAVLAALGNTDCPSNTAQDPNNTSAPFMWHTGRGWTSGFYPGLLWMLGNATSNRFVSVSQGTDACTHIENLVPASSITKCLLISTQPPRVQIHANAGPPLFTLLDLVQPRCLCPTLNHRSVPTDQP